MQQTIGKGIRAATKMLRNNRKGNLAMTNAFNRTSSLILPTQKAHFGGMMGMGELADILAGKCDDNDPIELWEIDNRSGILLSMDDKPGILNVALQILAQHSINMTSIHSIPPKTIDGGKLITIAIDFEGNFDMPNVQMAMKQLEAISKGVTQVGSREVPWFPQNINDFNHIGKRILSEGDGIQDADHPGFRDPVYRARREEITKIALEYKVGEPITPVTYTDQENEVWKYCYGELIKMFPTHACEQFNWTINEF